MRRDLHARLDRCKPATEGGWQRGQNADGPGTELRRSRKEIALAPERKKFARDRIVHHADRLVYRVGLEDEKPRHPAVDQTLQLVADFLPALGQGLNSRITRGVDPADDL